MTRPALRRAFALFLPVAVAATLGCSLVYVVVQQDLRSGANDPQVQLAEDAAARLDGGSGAAAVVPAGDVDIARSLAPFVEVFGTTGQVLAADGRVDGSAPVPPAGVLSAARSTGRDIVTWQPRGGVRIAAVVIPWSGGTVLAGRSLRLVEERESNTQAIVLVAWLAILVATLLASALAAWLRPGARERPAG